MRRHPAEIRRHTSRRGRCGVPSFFLTVPIVSHNDPSSFLDVLARARALAAHGPMGAGRKEFFHLRGGCVIDIVVDWYRENGCEEHTEELGFSAVIQNCGGKPEVVSPGDPNGYTAC